MLNPKTTCPLQTGNEEILLDYCARALDAERTTMLEAHIEQCRACSDMARAQSAIWSAMDAFTVEPVSAGFDRKLYARIEKLERVPAWERYWTTVREYLQGQPAWKPVLSVAAASAVVLLVFLVRIDRQQPAHSPAPVIDVRAVEQTERVLEDLEMLRQLEVYVPADSGGASTPAEVL